MRLDVMKQRFLMFLRDFREYVTEWETRRKAREAFRADLERAAQKRRNRSDGAKRGWAKRKLDAQLAKVNAGATIGGNGVTGATGSQAVAGTRAGETPVTPTPATWDDHDLDCVASA